MECENPCRRQSDEKVQVLPPLILIFKMVTFGPQSLLKNDEDIMATIIDAVSQAIVKKLLDTPSFLTSLAQNVT